MSLAFRAEWATIAWIARPPTITRQRSASRMRRLALIAHDNKKVDLVAWATYNRDALARFALIATHHTARLMRDKVGLEVEELLPGPQGGDAQIPAVGQGSKERGAVALPRAAVHTGERRRLQGGNPLQQRARIARVRVVVERHPHRLAGLEDVGFGHGRVARARLGEEIAAEEGLRPGLEQVAAFPGVRQMRRVDPADRVGAEPERLAVGQDAGRPVEGVAVDHPVDATTQRLG